MSRSRWTLIALAAGPALLAALVGLTHPTDLNPDTATYWKNMHVGLIFIFPLMGLAPWLIARRVDRRLGWLGAVAGFGFATLYTALDILAGVAGGALVEGGQAEATGPVFAIARTLARIGVYSLVVGALVAGAAAIWWAAQNERRRLPAAAVGLILAAAGTWLIYDGHIYVPLGTVALLLTAAGFGLMALVVSHAEPHIKPPTGTHTETQSVSRPMSPGAASSTTTTSHRRTGRSSPQACPPRTQGDGCPASVPLPPRKSRRDTQRNVLMSITNRYRTSLAMTRA